MSIKIPTLHLCVWAAVWLLGGGGAHAAEALPVPDSITAHGVPAIPRAVADELRPYENTRAANLAGLAPR